MPVLLHIALRSLRHHAVRTGVLALCVAITLMLPALSRVLVERYQRELTARADTTPLVMGAKGNRYDLVLAALYFRRGAYEPIRMKDYREFASRNAPGAGAASGTAVPMHVRFTAQGAPVVATTPEYYERRGLRLASGTLPARIGEAMVGADVAASLDRRVGDSIFSDQIDSFDISKPPALKMPVVGVLGPTGTPDDLAVFVDLKTAWVLEGVSHGHADPVKGIPEKLILSRDAAKVSVSEEMIEYNEVTPVTAPTFHIHGDESALPLSAVLYFPDDEKSETIAKARVNSGASAALQMVSPRQVIDELLSYVVRVRALLDVLFVLMALSTAALMTLLAVLSARVRAREFETLHYLGCGRWFVVRLFTMEMALVLVLGLVIAAGGVALVVVLAPDAAHAIEGRLV